MYKIYTIKLKMLCMSPVFLFHRKYVNRVPSYVLFVFLRKMAVILYYYVAISFNYVTLSDTKEK